MERLKGQNTTQTEDVMKFMPTQCEQENRTYFFDVRATRNKDYYLTITESKKRFHEDGSSSYEKHKIFLYKEDFKKFSDAMGDAFKKVIELKNAQGEEMVSDIDNQFTDISFDELEDSSSKE